MNAIVYTGLRELKLLDVETPSPGTDEVLIRVEAAGICGSELEGVATNSPFRVPPLIMGHEFIGRRMDDGKRVAVNPLVSCGLCDLCRGGRQNICRQRAIIGIQRPGAFAEFVAVPTANCIEMDVNHDTAIPNAVFTEPIANAVHALALASAGDASLPPRVGIIGAGPVGFAVAFVAVNEGVESVAISDLSVDRRNLAEASGAHSVTTELEGEFDWIFDAVGTEQTRAMSVDLVRPGGTVIWIGLHGKGATLDVPKLVREEKRIVASFCYTPSDFSRAAELVWALEPGLVAARPLEDGVAAFLGLMGGDQRDLKTALVPSGA